jgi:hypothetical protein
VRLHGAIVLPFLLLVACGTSGVAVGDGGVEGGGFPDGATPADGGGVCCPINGSPPCGCAGGGGWAATASACLQGGACDAWFDTTIDSHGCVALVGNTSKCCGCPIRDASADAPVDAGTASCTSASQCRLFSDYCGGCTCDPLGTNQPDPFCPDAGVTCIVDPCQGKTAVCDSTQHCAAQ